MSNALPQVARAFSFARAPAPALLLVPEYSEPYADLAVLGAPGYIHPEPEAGLEASHWILSYAEAQAQIEYLPSLLLKTGELRPRSQLASEFEKVGLERGTDYQWQGEVLILASARIDFEADRVARIETESGDRSRLLLRGKDPLRTARLAAFQGPVYLELPGTVPPSIGELLVGREVRELELAGAQALTGFRGRLSLAKEQIGAWLREGYAVNLFYRHQRTRDYLLSGPLAGLSWRQRPGLAGPGELALSAAGFSGGFQWQNQIFLTESLLFEFSGAPRVKKALKPVANDALSLGDYLIHPEHGIGQFEGMETRETLGVQRDYLVLRYAGEGRLYLPVEHLAGLRRFPATTDDPPELASLGKAEWKKKLAAARAAAAELAARLLVLEAQRQSLPGTAFPPLPDWDPLIEQSFPHQLTADQKTAITNIQEELAESHPMDHLLLGDAGFGKTEVAIRAIHRVVGHGYQVAFLVPTTLLAEQHYQNISTRFAELPVRIAKLSRFSRPGEVSAVSEGLRRGEIDLVIGTHRLLGEDLKFARLGLLIVDEEHLFGVAQKEKIRGLGQGIDFLAISATPIPRTLYQALVGLRGLSTLRTPPVGRQQVQTILSPFDFELVREAILREVERGGQVIYIHDRIRTIASRAQTIARLVPEASLAVVHGQMPERESEEVMLHFQNGGIDLLLATTIVESGLDIPEAGTIIVERSDRLGLASLYQLRGRVGRRGQAGVAYLLHPQKLTEGAERRLAAIADLSDHGSGYLLAQRDMEIRGIGNLLGPEQHGFVQAVSLEIYAELVAQAVAELKGEPRPEPEPEVMIDLLVSARIPPEYIPDPSERNRIYGRLAQAQNLAQLAKVRREIQNAQGPLPKPLLDYIDLIELRLLAAKKGVERIVSLNGGVEIAFRRWPVEYDRAALARFAIPTQETRHPRGFYLKKTATPRQVIELLYLIA